MKEKNPANRCCVCGKFCRWENLVMVHFIPDNEFSGEDVAYACLDCNSDG